MESKRVQEIGITQEVTRKDMDWASCLGLDKVH
jgi:hypothetical protein